jgi:hypothetical protein
LRLSRYESNAFASLFKSDKAGKRRLTGTALLIEGFPLLSNKRHTSPPLTARAPVRNEPAMKGICFFFRAAKPLEKGKRRNDNDKYAQS